jgi:hypothetical protein
MSGRHCAGTWSVRSSLGTASWIKRIGLADDLEPATIAKGDKLDPANPPPVLSFFQAQEVARFLAQQEPGASVEDSRPATLDEALNSYRADLIAHGSSKYNETTARGHLPASLLAKPVALLGSGELKRWRDSLIGKVKPSSVNRFLKSLKACLALADKHDPRIKNQAARSIGLESLPDAETARNVILKDDQVRAFVAAAYEHDEAFGLLTDVLARSGARTSQVARLCADDLVANPPRLMMPRSGKGKSRNRAARKAQRVSVPIPETLALRLAQAAKGRADDAPLLVRSNGTLWVGIRFRSAVREVVASIGLDPNVVTMYALRHSSIVRQLLLNVPSRIIASTHDTSVAMIEKHYSKHIAEHADAVSRRAMLQDEPLGDNVVAIGGRSRE